MLSNVLFRHPLKKQEVLTKTIRILRSRRVDHVPQYRQKGIRRMLLAMKLVISFTVCSFFSVYAKGFGQGITLSAKNESLSQVFRQIEKQTDYIFLYYTAQLDNAKKVTFTVNGADLKDVLRLCFEDQPVTYKIVDKTIVIKNVERTSGTNITSDAPVGLLNVRGKVIDEKNQPVQKASVSVKGTRKATATDERGDFELRDINNNAILIISSVGYKTTEIYIESRETITVQLQIEVGNLDEAVVVAYNTTTQRTAVGSFTVVKGDQIQTLPNRSFDKSLQGLVPGLLVSPGSGLPGGGVGNFVMRGVATNAETGNFSTVRNPLIILDGVPITQESSQITYRNGRIDYANAINTPLAQLNPSDIESISVLKDAAAIALYGAKSSNGVILVTTKRGKAGATQYGFRQQTDIAISKSPYDMLNQSEYLDLLIEAYKNSNPTTYPDDASVVAKLKTIFPTRSDGSFYPEVNWYDELNKSWALTLSNEFYLSGGDEKTSYYLALDYTKQNGIRKMSSFDRKSLRFNFEKRPTSWLKLGLNSTVSHSVQDYGGSAYGTSFSAAGLTALEISPLNPVRLENGEYLFKFSEGGAGGYGNFPNPVAQLEHNINRNSAFRGLMRLYGEIVFLKNFRLLTSLGTDFTLTESKEKNDPRLVDPLTSGLGGRIEEQDTRIFNLITTNILRYDKQLNKNNRINILVGQEAQILNRKNLDVAVTGITNPYYDQISSPGAVIYGQYGFTLKETLLSYFSQLNYDFKSRYFITASLRRDGSSRFGEDKRFGTYWATGAGWLVSAEPFMHKASAWLDHLKIRGSIGAAGNAGAIDRFTPYDRLQAGRYINGTAVMPYSLGNPDIKWENTLSWNVGLDVRLFNDRFGFTGDIYTRNTSNLIYSIPLPLNTGYPEVLGNLGKMRNTGIEFSVNAEVVKGRDFSWTVNANWSKNTNKLVTMGVASPATTLSVIRNKEGESFGSFYLRRWAGVNPNDGTPQWIDSTGKITSDYNATKPEFVGKSQPDGFGSVTNIFRYKGFELSVMLYYQYGYQIYFTNFFSNDGLFPYVNQSRDALDRWQKPGDIAANPKRVLFDPNGTFSKQSTRNLFNGDHIRLQNVILSYNINSNKLKRIGLKATRVFIQGNNLAFWATKGSSTDPSGTTTSGTTDVANVPMPTSLSIGINLSF